MKENGISARRILVTGGSGFIGTNVVERFVRSGCEVCSIDVNPPHHAAHEGVFRNVDILDADGLCGAMDEFRPQCVVHLAARTTLEGRGLDDYRANTEGVENLAAALSQTPTVRRCIFVSTKLICRNDYVPKSFDDYCPDTVYGQSKVLSERIVKDNTSLRCQWCIVRPTGIWGPWFGEPYRRFFLMVARGRYVHPGGTDAPKSLGYVGNVAFQIEKLLTAPDEKFHAQTFYLSDYTPLVIRNWADTISQRLRGRPVRRVPGPLMRIAALAGDALKLCGVKNPPITTFRLRNMKADTSGIPLDNIQVLTGSLPYSLQQGVDETIAWLRGQNLLT